MEYIALIYSKEKYNNIIRELEKYNIFPINIGSWENFKYISYDVRNKKLTNHSYNYFSGEDVVFCYNSSNFVNLVLMANNMKKEFSIEDIKVGMVVEIATGDKTLVTEINNEIVLVSNSSCIRLNDKYNDNLTHKESKHFNINKIYKVKNLSIFSELMKKVHNNYLELIWQRQEIKELTLQEIADKFGYPVEQIRIKQ